MRFTNTSTTIRFDEATRQNRLRSRGTAGWHDVVIHGRSDGTFGTEANPVTSASGGIHHPQQIADIVRSNPHNQQGQPIRLVSCYGLRGHAGDLADRLNVPVLAGRDPVDLDSHTGLLRVQPPGHREPHLATVGREIEIVYPATPNIDRVHAPTSWEHVDDVGDPTPIQEGPW